MFKCFSWLYSRRPKGLTRAQVERSGARSPTFSLWGQSVEEAYSSMFIPNNDAVALAKSEVLIDTTKLASRTIKDAYIWKLDRKMESSSPASGALTEEATGVTGATPVGR